MPKYSVLLARPTYRGHERKEVGTWLAETLMKCKADPRVGQVSHIEVDDTPAPMVRNAILKGAMDAKFDLVCMIDDDMEPDLYLKSDPRAKPFFETAFDFMTTTVANRPCMTAAPYCGLPPMEVVMAFQWCNWQSDHPGADSRLEMFTREEAANRQGIEEAGAVGTGLCLISVAGYASLPEEALPWFRYEYKDKYETEKSTTEDCYFSRNLSLYGVPSFVLWDCWSGHWKPKCVGKPRILTCDMVRENYRGAIRNGYRHDTKLMVVGAGE